MLNNFNYSAYLRLKFVVNWRNPRRFDGNGKEQVLDPRDTFPVGIMEWALSHRDRKTGKRTTRPNGFADIESACAHLIQPHPPHQSDERALSAPIGSTIVQFNKFNVISSAKDANDS